MSEYPRVTQVCIIGSGVGGGVMAEQLASAGIDVVVLERGKNRGPSEFLGQTELGAMLRPEFFVPDYLETKRGADGEETQAGRFSLLAQTVGGSAVHWGAWSWRFLPEEMKRASLWGQVNGAHLADWPISYEELAPYYTKAEQILGLSGSATGNPYGAPIEKAYPNPPHVYRPASKLIEKGAKARGLTPFPIPLAINSRVNQGRAKCMNGGLCAGFGCPIHAKASPLSIQLPRAIATGKCQVIADARVTEIVLDSANRARGVRYLDQKGEEREIKAKQIVLAAGSIGSAQILLSSKSWRYPSGLANSSDQVGRNLMCHIFAQTNFEMDQPSLSVVGPPGNIAVDDFHASDPDRGFLGGAVIGEAMEAMPLGSALKVGGYLGSHHRAWGKPLRKYLEKFPYIGGMVSIGEDLPQQTNRIDLDPQVTDKYGIPVPRITHARHPNDMKLVKFFERQQEHIADAGGARKVWSTDFSQMGTSSGHIMGTCRMGGDPETSVINRWCKTHDVDNLWVVDGSFFPTSGGYNPTLTIFANAYRVADYFLQQVKLGDVK